MMDYTDGMPVRGLRMTIRDRTGPFMLLVGSLVACGGSTTDTLAPSVAAVASIRIVSPLRTVAQGYTERMNVELRDKRGTVLPPRPMTWRSSDLAIASVSSDGDVRGVTRSGTATITVTVEGKSDSTTLATYWAYVYSITPKYTVAVSSPMISDDVRRRDIPIIARVPVGAPEPVPVIFEVFGLLDGYKSSAPMGDAYAAAGYVVIHAGTTLYSTAQLCAELGVTDCTEMIWPNRLAVARDVKYLLDNLALIGTRIGVRLDAAHVGISGVSSGGAIVMYLAGATVDLSPTVRAVSLADNRISAFFGNSAPATRTDNGSPSGFTKDSWTPITKPTMQQVLSGDVDASGRASIFDLMPSGDKYLAYFNTPLLFTYFPNQVEPWGGLIASNALAFFDTYLRGSAEAKEWLTTNQLARGSNGVAQMSVK